MLGSTWNLLLSCQVFKLLFELILIVWFIALCVVPILSFSLYLCMVLIEVHRRFKKLFNQLKAFLIVLGFGSLLKRNCYYFTVFRLMGERYKLFAWWLFRKCIAANGPSTPLRSHLLVLSKHLNSVLTFIVLRDLCFRSYSVSSWYWEILTNVYTWT